jgi:hypothetical protein
MKATLLLHDCPPTDGDFVKMVEKLLGPCRSRCVGEPGSLEGFEAVALLFSADCDGMSAFEEANRAELRTKRVALICASGDGEMTLERLRMPLGDCVLASLCVDPGDEEAVSTLVGVKRALMDASDAPEEALLEHIERFLRAHNTCALCTASGGRVRATPIEYRYEDGCFVFVSEGGEKFLNLSWNEWVSIAVFDSYAGFGKLEGLQAEGRAEVVEDFSSGYLAGMAARGLTEDRLRALPAALHMVKVVPDRFEILSSSLGQRGYAVRQVWRR